MKVFLLGAGPGDPGLLTIKSKEILSKADVIIYDALANDKFLEYAKDDAEKIYVGKIADNHALPQDEINKLLVKKAKEGKIVARLKGGDPYIFGRGGEEAEALIEEDIEFEEVPGISSTIAAPAYAGIPLTHRDYTSSVTIITGHEKYEKSSSAHNWDALAKSSSTLVFVMGMKNLPIICKNLIDAGMSKNTPAGLIYRGTTTKQRSLIATLETLPTKAIEKKFTNPSVIVVGKVAKLHEKFNWFEKKPLLGKSIVVTRAREQASSLANNLEQLGAEIIQCPTIKIKDITNYEKLDNAINNLNSYNWIIFTSVNGVKKFFKRLKNKNLDSRSLYNCKICAIGPATNDSLANYGLKADFVPEKYQAEGIIEGLKAFCSDNLKNLNILIPRAKQAREILPQELIKYGANVDIIPVYETIPDIQNKELVLQRLEEGTLSCITFGSSSTVTNFLNIIPKELLLKHNETKLASIGPITSNTLEKNGLKADIQPNEFTIPALILAIKEHFSK